MTFKLLKGIFNFNQKLFNTIHHFKNVVIVVLLILKLSRTSAANVNKIYCYAKNAIYSKNNHIFITKHI